MNKHHTSFGNGGAVENARAAWEAADAQWRDTFTQSQALAAAGDQAGGIALAAQSRAEFDHSVELKKVLDDVTASNAPSATASNAPSAVPIPGAGMSLFDRWQGTRVDLMNGIAAKLSPGLIQGLQKFEIDTKAAYLATNPSLEKRWSDLNAAWAAAIKAKAPANQLADLQMQSEDALAALSHSVARAQKAQKDATSSQATTTTNITSLVIVTAPLWIYALARKFL